MHRDTQVGIVVRRAGGAVAHFISACCWLDSACQQQGQGGRAVGGIRGLKIVTRGFTTERQPTTHLHELRRALGLPCVLLFSGELYPHRRAHGLGQHSGIGGHIVCAVSTVTTCGLHAHHFHFGVSHAAQQSQIGAQHVRVLRAGPHPQLQGWRLCI